ncbi:MBL fold metallo-hydrolase [Fulvimonas soli]|jgi:L-ascorbate metabolism protein UlaG (beta-lactamase superfamily)|uniref:L-ascorbate metabolism protein UlaG (Beta-lactamase superfamily) n=1 Tax=Fulvimonas soli TaxID=155197 RepID=A0A316IIE9_9GAMM|nr:MBL fold metallo-hydrolase [Fulvimonas soli]PWK92496.1 L-ascorbate metabolism protein UlaG (beta-lactamase superfamily) [Fulvimonas soli]TNY27711.1 MBL fold metallo-hydrolase [Fulvimonas soli]
MAWRNPHYDPSRAHHTPEGFRNLEPEQRRPGDLQRWRAERKAAGLPIPPREGYEAFARRWWQPADLGGEENAAWWLGHACVLLRLDGRYVITDPVFSERVSPLSFIGPKRRTPPAATIEQLPRIDAVLVSHSHYDHLDTASIRALAKRFPEAAFAAPLGLAATLRKLGARHAHELDWWQSLDTHGFELTCVPARHWSARTPWDRNRTLWGGWVARHGGFRFYFAGDTGYSPRLAEIGARLGPIDLAALPIGAYAPRWFMRAQHIDPAEAVQLHRELGCRHSLAIHWGAFELADDPLDEPPRLLAEALAAQGVSAEAFRALPVGARWPLAEGGARAAAAHRLQSAR